MRHSSSDREQEILLLLLLLIRIVLQGQACKNSRGEERRPVHQGAIVVVADEVVQLGGLIAGFRPVGDLHVDGVTGVVEVNDEDVENQHRRRRNDITWGQKKTTIFTGGFYFILFFLSKNQKYILFWIKFGFELLFGKCMLNVRYIQHVFLLNIYIERSTK